MLSIFINKINVHTILHSYSHSTTWHSRRRPGGTSVLPPPHPPSSSSVAVLAFVRAFVVVVSTNISTNAVAPPPPPVLLLLPPSARAIVRERRSRDDDDDIDIYVPTTTTIVVIVVGGTDDARPRRHAPRRATRDARRGECAVFVVRRTVLVVRWDRDGVAVPPPRHRIPKACLHHLFDCCLKISRSDLVMVSTASDRN